MPTIFATSFAGAEARTRATHPTADDWLSLSYHYENGIAVQRDEGKAVEHARRALDVSPLPATMFRVGLVLREQSGAELAAEGRLMIEKAAEQGYKAAAIHLGTIDANIVGEHENGFRCLAEAATRGSIDAAYSLAAKIRYGILTEPGVPVSSDVYERERVAFKWFEVAAKGGHRVAMVQLGRYYSDGIVAKKDDAEAARLFAAAAMCGDAIAALELARCYELGNRWYVRSATTRHADPEAVDGAIAAGPLCGAQWADALLSASEKAIWSQEDLHSSQASVAHALAAHKGLEQSVEFCRHSGRVVMLTYVVRSHMLGFGDTPPVRGAGEMKAALRALAIVQSEGNQRDRSSAKVVMAHLKLLQRDSVAAGDAQCLFEEAAKLGNSEAVAMRAMHLWATSDGDVVKQRAALAMSEEATASGCIVTHSVHIMIRCTLAAQLCSGIGGDKPDYERAAELLRGACRYSIGEEGPGKFLLGCLLLDDLLPERDETDDRRVSDDRLEADAELSERDARAKVHTGLQKCTFDSVWQMCGAPKAPFCGFARRAIDQGALKHQPDLLCALLSEIGVGRVHNVVVAREWYARALQANGVVAPVGVDVAVFAKLSLILTVARSAGEHDAPLADLANDGCDSATKLAHVAQRAHEIDVAFVFESLLQIALSVRGDEAMFVASLDSLVINSLPAAQQQDDAIVSQLLDLRACSDDLVFADCASDDDDDTEPDEQVARNAKQKKQRGVAV